jgi:hypothetical protein
MDRIDEFQVLDAEKRLWNAISASDIPVLDALLAPELVFTNHLGQIFGKKDDLAFHASKLFTIKELRTSEQRVHMHKEMAIVTVRVGISGTFAGMAARDDLRFTRIWALSPARKLHMIAGHSCIVAKS